MLCRLTSFLSTHLVIELATPRHQHTQMLLHTFYQHMASNPRNSEPFKKLIKVDDEKYGR